MIEPSLGSGQTRYIALWVPNWPLASLVARTPPDTAAVIEHGRRIVVVSPKAARKGVRVGMTRTLAQYYCSELLVLKHDEERESGAFEVLLEVFDSYAADVSVVRPGLAFAPATSAAKWAGSEESLVEKIIDDIAAYTGAEAYIGIGTGIGTALLAARKNLVVPERKTREFLRGLPLRELVQDLPEGSARQVSEILTTLLGLGIYTAGDLEKLGASPVISRFGQGGETLFRLLSGEQPALSIRKRSESTVNVFLELDPPVGQIEHAMTAISRVSNDLADRLRSSGLYASAVQVVLMSQGGRRRERTWTLLDATSSSQVAKRIAWQLKGWIDTETDSISEEPDPLASIELVAVDPGTLPEIDPLWGGTRTSWKAAQAAEQVQGLLGEESVLSPSLHGGFDPRTRVSLTPWGTEKEISPKTTGEWEGGVSDPPIILFSNPPEAMLIGVRLGSEPDPIRGRLWITRRGVLNGTPERLIVHQDRSELAAGDYPISQVNRLWVVSGRWWKPDDQARGSRCYLRVSRSDGPDLLLVQRKGNWYVEGIYGSLISVHSPVGMPLVGEN
ncbi:DNA polymerase Y family protein [Actinomycetaceae bacterium MB13-C1-2]|nr:DNA polymerase Y family protein [Actinomycetaceae bacterium MB13-C1-2]